MTLSFNAVGSAGVAPGLGANSGSDLADAGVAGNSFSAMLDGDGGGAGPTVPPRPGDDPSTAYALTTTSSPRRQGIVLDEPPGHDCRQHARWSRRRARGGQRRGDLELAGNVFLSARRVIDAVQLDAGGNFWGASSLSDAQRQVRAGYSSLPSARPARPVLDANSEWPDGLAGLARMAMSADACDLYCVDGDDDQSASAIAIASSRY